MWCPGEMLEIHKGGWYGGVRAYVRIDSVCYVKNLNMHNNRWCAANTEQILTYKNTRNTIKIFTCKK